MPLLVDKLSATKEILARRMLEESPAASGVEGSMIQKQVEEVLRHFFEHDSMLLTHSESEKLARLKAMHFTEEGKAARVAKALQALKDATPLPGLDKNTWEWIAEDMGIEDI